MNLRRRTLLGFILVFNIVLVNLSYGQERIITLSSSITETIFGLGIGDFIVATDVTSVSPKAAAALPRVSSNRSVSTEGLLSFKPTIILGNEGDVSPEIVKQVKAAGVKFITLQLEYSPKGALNYIQQIADAVDQSELGKKMVLRTKVGLDNVLASIKANQKTKKRPKVLFIYARGTGTMSVAGKGSSIDAMLILAGAQNAVQEFSDFKPYTTESLVKANPDVILMFDFGANSLGGKKGILDLPGMQTTQAGKNGRILVMNPSLLVNFSNRLPDAIMELNQGINKLLDSK